MANPNVQDAARAGYEAVREYDWASGTDWATTKAAPAWADLDAPAKLHLVDEAIWIMGNPDATPQTVHEAWMRTKLEAGWLYGPTFDATTNPPTSPSLVAWDDLPLAKQLRSVIFLSMVSGFAAAAYRAPLDVQAELDKQAAAKQESAPRLAKLGDTVWVNTPGRPLSNRTQHTAIVTDPGDGTTLGAVVCFPANSIAWPVSSLPPESSIDRKADQKAQSWQFPA